MPRAGSPLQRVRRRAEARLRAHGAGRRWIVEQFHHVYFDAGRDTWLNTHWRGTHVAKSPPDLWRYQEAIAATRPDLIVETGTFRGGSALFFADLLELLGVDGGQVLSIDLDERAGRPEHPRVAYLTGSSIAPGIVAEVAERAARAERVMVVLDSDHSAAHVGAELDALHGFVSPGGYLVVEDTVVNGHPILPAFGPGPHEAVEAFLRGHPEFERDPDGSKFLMSFNHGGWLRRRPA